MKSLTIILTTAILFFVVKPGVDLISLKNTSEQTCCSGSCIPIEESQKLPDHKKQDDDCSGKACNPFQVCCCCLILCVIDHSTDLLKPENSRKQKCSRQSDFISQFAPDFWQPPKIA